MQSFDYKNFFKDKKITKQGFGVLGRGFGVVKFLLESGAEVLVTDIKPQETFREQINELKKYEEAGSLKYVLGGHRDEDFTNCDFVIAGSGVPKDNYYLNLSKKNNIPVYQETSLFAKLVIENLKNVKIIGVTGTRGKTTTTFLIYELLKKSFGQENVHIGGNVQGVATLEILKNIKDGDYVVLELDSWVLQGFNDLKISPNISVFTSFMPDHMNYYKNNLEEYFEDKASIFKYQTANDFFVTTDKVVENIKNYKGQAVMFVVKTSEEKKYPTKLLGSHNQILLELVEKVSEILHIDKNIFQEVVENFKGVPGRLELVREVNGIKIYNDTCATTPDAVTVALESLGDILEENRKIYLLCGGKDKELELSIFAKKLEELQEKNILEIYLLNDETTTGTKKLIEEIEKENLNIRCTTVESLQAGVADIRKNIKTGDILLFSPGFASFGMFQNEYDRGDKFNELIKNF